MDDSARLMLIKDTRQQVLIANVACDDGALLGRNILGPRQIKSDHVIAACFKTVRNQTPQIAIAAGDQDRFCAHAVMPSAYVAHRLSVSRQIGKALLDAMLFPLGGVATSGAENSEK